ncbi:MAG: hypothetical protein CMJ31_04910 [Phycisphaerae bacterium]|nr:hypothetical protein [Phycisphaerae bacterium]
MAEPPENPSGEELDAQIESLLDEVADAIDAVEESEDGAKAADADDAPEDADPFDALDDEDDIAAAPSRPKYEPISNISYTEEDEEAIAAGIDAMFSSPPSSRHPEPDLPLDDEADFDSSVVDNELQIDELDSELAALIEDELGDEAPEEVAEEPAVDIDALDDALDEEIAAAAAEDAVDDASSTDEEDAADAADDDDFDIDDKPAAKEDEEEDVVAEAAPEPVVAAVAAAPKEWPKFPRLPEDSDWRDWLKWIARIGAWAAPIGLSIGLRYLKLALRWLDPRAAKGLVLIGIPVDRQSALVRSCVGWFAFYTGFVAICVWGFVLIFREPPSPTPPEDPVRLTEVSGAAPGE